MGCRCLKKKEFPYILYIEEKISQDAAGRRQRLLLESLGSILEIQRKERKADREINICFGFIQGYFIQRKNN